MISRTAIIGASVGLHARPAALVAEAVDSKGIDVGTCLSAAIRTNS